MGNGGLGFSSVAASPPVGAATAGLTGQRAPAAPVSASTVGSHVLACGGRTGFYACGRNAMECCAVTQDNPCFSGTYACKVDASQVGANMMCCLMK
jgi:hypothetical protein